MGKFTGWSSVFINSFTEHVEIIPNRPTFYASPALFFKYAPISRNSPVHSKTCDLGVSSIPLGGTEKWRSYVPITQRKDL